MELETPELKAEYEENVEWTKLVVDLKDMNVRKLTLSQLRAIKAIIDEPKQA